jgi:TPR repeat protein
MFAEGRVIPRDLTEAAKWFRKAAEQGHILAQRRIERIRCEDLRDSGTSTSDSGSGQ